MSTAVITDLQKGYAALRNLESSQDTSGLSALTTSNAILQAEITGFREKLLGQTVELPNGEHILAAEHELLCQLAGLNCMAESKIVQSVKKIEWKRVVLLTMGTLALKDISPLREMTGLWGLALDSHLISDYRPLSALTKLECLAISSKNIATIEALSSLTGLKALSLTRSEITDLGPLSGMHVMETLDLVCNRISDLTPLAGIKSLRMLYLSNNQISDITPLSGLKALEELVLLRNHVTDLSVLLELPKLKNLSVICNPLAPDAKAVLDELRARGTICNAPEGF